MASNGVRLLVGAALICLLAAAPRANAAISCGQVASNLGPCIDYIRGAAPLSASCCSGVRGLNAAAQTTPDRQAACSCLKSLAGRIPGMQAGLAAGLPGKCGVSIPYPISTSTDCSK
ncbi:hypothetical protein Taro_031129 [Colocasia esculenta]|uniref:Non-specific lipid-transfer protein n=1 Tax=Colocasia esculenta TaxID=4460 RepID=A0A843VVV4_COLES|nr:hypothetical protein [Colocasia esculenta]